MYPGNSPLYLISRPYRRPLLITRSYISTNHLAQLILLRKLPTQDLHVANQGLAAVHQRLLWAYRAVSLHTEFEFREERMRDLVTGKDDVGVFEEMRAEDVGKRVIFLIECEDGAVSST